MPRRGLVVDQDDLPDVGSRRSPAPLERGSRRRFLSALCDREASPRAPPGGPVIAWHVKCWTLFARMRPLGKCGLSSRSEPHAAWSPSGLKGGVLANAFDSREAQKIFWLFGRA